MEDLPWNARTLGGERTDLLRLEPPELRAALLELVEGVFDPSVASALAHGVARLAPEALLRFASWVEVHVPEGSEIIAPLDSRLERGPDTIRFVTEFESYRTEAAGLIPDRSEVTAGEVVVPGAPNLPMRLHVLGALHVHDLYETELATIFGGASPEHLVLIRALLGLVRVVEPGDTGFERGQLVSREGFLDRNDRVLAEGGFAGLARETLVPLSALPGHLTG